jgi:predicted component of type VI protein secretion system
MLLQQGGNDVLVLTYLAYALLEQFQWPGFLLGLELLQARLTLKWEDLYPLKLKARMAAVAWLLERYQRFMASHALQQLSFDRLSALLLQLKNFDATLALRFNQEINVLGMVRSFETQVQRLQEEERSKALVAERALEATRLQQERLLQETLVAHETPVSAGEYLQNMATAELHQLAFERLFQDQIALLKQDPLQFTIYKHHRSELWFGSTTAYLRMPRSFSRRYEFIGHDSTGMPGVMQSLS